MSNNLENLPKNSEENSNELQLCNNVSKRLSDNLECAVVVDDDSNNGGESISTIITVEQNEPLTKNKIENNSILVRNNLVKYPEIHISKSTDDNAPFSDGRHATSTGATKTATDADNNATKVSQVKSVADVKEFCNEFIMKNDLQSMSSTSCCSHYCSGLRTNATAAFDTTSSTDNDLSDEDLRAIIRELKNKVEYTEKMNWLCLGNRPMGPPHRKTSLPKHTDVKKRFLEICDNTLSDEVIAALRLPAFDSYEWEDEDVLHLMQTMFIETGLVEKFNIPINTLREWLYEVYKHYNSVPFHNFRHCFCVAQMMYAIAWHTNLSARLGDLEILILLVSCICHDLDHPGYNNIYQINARTELALRYNDISPLENHHCSIAFRLLEHPDCNIFKNFNKETFKEIREGIIRCILATDMARHNEILSQFQEVSPVFDYSNQSHINLLCMILIKVADISNEARPMDIAEPWLERLLQEFFAQSAAEKSEGLPVTPFMDPDKVSKPGSQVRFIGLVLLPLFEALGELLPELIELIINPVKFALDYYKRLNDAQTKSRKSVVEMDGVVVVSSSESGVGSPQLPRSQSGISVRSRRSIPSQKSTSRTSVDEPLCISAELHDLPEGSESGDSETATEVEVAEKTSKFKVDTEGNNRTKNTSQYLANSRKVSREKRPSMISEIHTTGSGARTRGNHHNHYLNRSHFGANRAVSLDQYSRRLSDCVPPVLSDENSMIYNRQHRSLDNEVICLSNTIIAEKFQTEKCLNTNSTAVSLIKIQTDDCENMNKTICCMNNKNSLQNSSNVPVGKTAEPKTFMSRLRQFTGRFSFSLEKDPQRRTSTTLSANNLIASKNNNADIPKSGFCCNLSNRNPSPLLTAKSQCVVQTTPSRNRAYSLDVPIRTRYSSSCSGGGDSRKSSKTDDNNHHLLEDRDNNSNHTINSETKNELDLDGSGNNCPI